MNRLLYVTLVAWKCTNLKRQHRAEKWCKDYGLERLHKSLYMGTLYRKERMVLDKKMHGLLKLKQEQFFSFSICATCLDSASVDRELRKRITNQVPFELIQAKYP